MKITYDPQTDLLYIRLDERKQQVVNKKLMEGVVIDVGEGERIVGIEILDASKRVEIEGLLPVSYEVVAATK
ncbi:MAG: DUF2283 domain-containing protein [Deltaproteobacteria bacterium]|nr:MAG: DUF2283 domain-containing protein [Deltaproteobacteria bacterium]RLA98266.1 MAG: DUF2283 domain-containing protein [Deltaproteobacteria bacterium]